MSTKKLWLLPAPLSEDLEMWKLYEPKGFQEIVLNLEGLFAETPKVARYVLGPLFKEIGRALNTFPIHPLSEHTTLPEMMTYIEMVTKSKGDWGVMSDAGLVLLADPGSKLIELAKNKKIGVRTLGGASSIITALQLSGKTGQRFIFHGYFPTEEVKFKELLSLCGKLPHYTHLFIETPYRNQKQLQTLLRLQEATNPTAFLGIYAGLFSSQEVHLEMKIAEWKSWKGELPKEPAVFVLSYLSDTKSS